MNSLAHQAAPAKPGRSLMIQNLLPGLPERGKIKIGVKGREVTSKRGNAFQPPQKLDHFVVTTLERGPDGNFVRDEAIHAKLGDKPTRIPILLLYNDIELNFQSRYACFQGRKVWCSGDGDKAHRLNRDGKGTGLVDCTCERIEWDYPGQDKCKFNGTLSMMIQGAGGLGGVWKFRTTSVNSVRNLTGSMQLIKAASGGLLAGLPLDLVLTPKAAILPDGKQSTVYVVSVEFAGTVDELRAISHERALADAHHAGRMVSVEAEARRLLAGPQAGTGVFQEEDGDDVVHEFYPEQAAKPAPPGPRPTAATFGGEVLEHTAVPEPEPEPVLYPLVDPWGELIEDLGAADWLSQFYWKLAHVKEWSPADRDAYVENNADGARAIAEAGGVEGFSVGKWEKRVAEAGYPFQSAAPEPEPESPAQPPEDAPQAAEPTPEPSGSLFGDEASVAAPDPEEVEAYFQQLREAIPAAETLDELNAMSGRADKRLLGAMDRAQRREINELFRSTKSDLQFGRDRV